MYKKLMEQGWTMNDIDEMDIHWYFSVFDEEEETSFIDELNW